MVGIPEPASSNVVPLPANLKKRKSGDGGSGNDWWEILKVLAQSEYAKRVGVERALRQYLEARSAYDIKEAFNQIVHAGFWSRLLYLTKGSKINVIISHFV
ncbi:MAG: hypothetical protein ACM3PP_05370 [Candidatus Saccharibacteria bacterium]